MKTKRLAISSLLTCGILLAGCSIFNDDEFAINNVYNTPTTSTSTRDPNAIVLNDVEAINNPQTPDAMCFKNIDYSKNDAIPNTYKEGGVNQNQYVVNDNKDYEGSKARNNYDLYVPKAANKAGENTVILFVHGGAWVSGFKTDVNPYVYEFANRGFITATIKYTLLSRHMDDPSLSIFRNLDEIDACITSIKESLTTLGFDTTKIQLVIGGASSGAHLSMLYAYSRGERAAFPIKFIVDAVGPVDIKPDCWKTFISTEGSVLDDGITSDAIADQESHGNLYKLDIAGEGDEENPVYWCPYQTMRIANGMCGLPYSLETVQAATDEYKDQITDPSNPAAISMTEAGGGEDLLSVTYWMKSTNKIPIACAYGGKDCIVGIAQFAALQAKLDDLGTKYEFFYFKNSDHTEIDSEHDAVEYPKFLDKVEDWCKHPIV